MGMAGAAAAAAGLLRPRLLYPGLEAREEEEDEDAMGVGVVE